MYLKRLSLTNFRNFARMDVEIPEGAVLLIGDNAQGKTSFLEAIYFLATFTSFHASSDRQLINFLAGREPLAVGRIIAEYQKDKKNYQLEMRIIQENNGIYGSRRVRKEVLLNGTKRKLNELIGHFNAVIFLPQMLGIIEGSPSERRRYINLTLAQVSPRYTAALSSYDKAINQRNALLKLLNERGGDLDQLEYWDENIASSGSILIYERIRALQEIESIAAMAHRGLTRGEEILRIDYKPAFDPIPQQPNQIAFSIPASFDRSGFSKEEIENGLYEELQKQREKEIARGQTTIGPHRDEIRFLANGIDLGTYGSRGQVRTTVLSLKIAEVTWMREKTGEWPVLLLDEVLAELDPYRRSDLLAILQESDQTLLTTTDLDLFQEEFVKNSTVWVIKQGTITKS
ncbi:MAG TPA: DNA replication/repair protein RecF [Anaerolineae bacterium]|nr:DNA replication/repair protein RecF [Anaerolineae bacterium]